MLGYLLKTITKVVLSHTSDLDHFLQVHVHYSYSQTRCYEACQRPPAGDCAALCGFTASPYGCYKSDVLKKTMYTQEIIPDQIEVKKIYAA